MVRRAIGAAVIVVLAALAAGWWTGFGTQTPPAAAQTPPPAIPVTAGTVAAEDVPVLLHGIGTAKLNLSYTDIRSPIDGRLGARLVDKGNLVRAGDNTTLVTITEVRPIFVNFTLPQSTLDAIRENQKAAPLIVRAYTGNGQK